MQRYVEQQDELIGRVRTVDGWLATLSPLERLAADYWLLDDEGTVTAVADAVGLRWDQARLLVRSVPLIIWGRCYYPEQSDAREYVRMTS